MRGTKLSHDSLLKFSNWLFGVVDLRALQVEFFFGDPKKTALNLKNVWQTAVKRFQSSDSFVFAIFPFRGSCIAISSPKF